MIFGGFSRATFAVAVTFVATLPAGADFKDKGPINYTVDGATASGYFKVVTEAINGLIRETYPGSAATYKPGSPAGGILNISRGQSDFDFQRRPTRNRLRARRQAAVHGIAQGQVQLRHAAASGAGDAQPDDQGVGRSPRHQVVRRYRREEAADAAACEPDRQSSVDGGACMSRCSTCMASRRPR